MEKTKCIYCDEEFEYKIYGNYAVRCPKCHRSVISLCDYGFGPVTPFHICLGDKQLGVVDIINNEYVLTYNNKVIHLKNTYMDAVQEAENIISE